MRFLLAACLFLTFSPLSAQSLNPAPAAAEPKSNAGLRELPPSELDGKLAGITDTAELVNAATALAARGQHVDSARVWRRLADLRPHMGYYRYEMAAELATNNYKALVYNALLHLQTQGYAFEAENDKRFVLVNDTQVWEYTVKALQANRERFGEGKVYSTLPREDLLIESLAWDDSRDALLVGSAREGAVYRVGADGKLTALLRADEQNGMWGVFDLAVDAERGVLWVASTAVPHFKGYDAEEDLGGAGIFKFDLKTGRFIKRFLSPQIAGQQFFMSSLALAPDGTVYAADGVNNAIYAVRDDQLKRVLHAPTLTSIRGMTVSADSRKLYFADYERGLFGMDLASMKPFEVAVPQRLALGGIDGVQMWKGQLVLVQNGMMPKRVIRVALSDDGRQITAVQPLEANQPALSLPTLATLDDDRLLLIANSQKGNYDRFGLVRDKDKLEATVIYELDLEFGDRAPTASPAPMPKLPAAVKPAAEPAASGD